MIADGSELNPHHPTPTGGSWARGFGVHPNGRLCALEAGEASTSPLGSSDLSDPLEMGLHA
jgi:hypothetical protein